MRDDADSPTLPPRHARARALMAEVGVTRLLVTSLPNVQWLTGFDGSAGCAIVEAEQVVLVTDRRYAETASRLAEAGDLGLAVVEQTYDETVVPLIAARDEAMGVEAVHLTVQRHRWLAAALSARGWPGSAGLVPTVDVIEAGRVVKDAWEIARLREGGRRISAVLTGVLADLAPGVRELDVAQALEAGLRRTGAARVAFDTIVASGPRSALPHGRASARQLDPGDLVVLDFGGVYGGYCLDLTRTVELAPLTAEAGRVHAAVAAAQRAAIEAIAPGVPFAEVDRAARDVLAAEGLVDRFVHGTGHGLGLEVHEAPRLGPARLSAVPPAPLAGTVRMPEVLAPGMVVTIEPGAYVPGWGGVRIEDDVLVTATGAELLTDVPVTLAAGDTPPRRISET